MTRRTLLSLPFIGPLAKAVGVKPKIDPRDACTLQPALLGTPLSAMELFGFKTDAIRRIPAAPLNKEQGEMLEVYLRAQRCWSTNPVGLPRPTRQKASATD